MIMAFSSYQTEQEQFWAGEFGDEYIGRNPENFEFGSRAALFTKILARTEQVNAMVELGANIGNNLKVLQQIRPQADLAGVEINAKAVEALQLWGGAEVYHQSILDFSPLRQWDLSFVSGVLIHINPELLPKVYEQLYGASSRYVALIEYYNPSPVEMSYRGHGGRLFKRDFAGEMLERFQDLRLLDYGFVYHGDPNFPLDDLTWFVMEKR